ncbi:MAG: LysM peptidoglycan-binding domain-containing protein [Clostridia bacterium]|jgi:LysM repeat protein|nr:LysM peptidoglycan-binding domain-containing protein [Clostridia bacterium]
MYLVYIGNILLPVAPEKISINYKGQNDTIKLINMEELSRIRTPGLTEYEFDAILPGGKVPYAQYLTTFKEPYTYIKELKEIFYGGKTVLFKIIRKDLPYQRVGFTTKETVTIERIGIVEAANDGLDVRISLKLKQYKAAKSTKTGNIYAQSSYVRTSSHETPLLYTVKPGDNLWSICKRELNNAQKYPEIAKLNGIKDPSKIYPGQVIKLE